jgi:hypothetical protein
MLTVIRIVLAFVIVFDWRDLIKEQMAQSSTAKLSDDNLIY